MATLIRIRLKNGTLLRGWSYHTDPTSPQPSLIGPTYSFMTQNGWRTILTTDIAEIRTQMGNPT